MAEEFNVTEALQKFQEASSSICIFEALSDMRLL